MERYEKGQMVAYSDQDNDDALVLAEIVGRFYPFCSQAPDKCRYRVKLADGRVVSPVAPFEIFTDPALLARL